MMIDFRSWWRCNGPDLRQLGRVGVKQVGHAHLFRLGHQHGRDAAGLALVFEQMLLEVAGMVVVTEEEIVKFINFCQN
jgi:hypothetical protein